MDNKDSTQSEEGAQSCRAPSPVPSCESLKSDWSKSIDINFSNDPSPPHPQAQSCRSPSPVPSCVSLKSDMSKDLYINFSNDPSPPHPHLTEDQSSCDQALRDPAIPSSGHQILSKQGKKNINRATKTFKDSLKRRFENISECTIKPGDETLLNDVYTDLYITQGDSEGVDTEHEVLQVESASRAQPTEDRQINCNDIFKPVPGQERHIRTVMTKGIAGIGKTVAVQKFILDWADGKANQNVDLIFPLPFRALNLIRTVQYSLHQLLLDFYPELQQLNIGEEYKDCKIVFIFDGLDESRLSLDFEQTTTCCDVHQTSSVNVLISSLIQGTLLPSALVWITSRPAAASQIPHQHINQVTEVRGFNDPQKDEYFRKRIRDESLSSRIMSHIKASKTLHIMCYIPVFCWIAATVLRQMLKTKNIKDIPKTLTEMFIHFLLIQTARRGEKYHSDKNACPEELLKSEFTLKLAKLAFKNVESGNLMFYEEDLRECDILVDEVSVSSGLCTEIFKEEPVFQQRKVYCFVHLTIQEFLAALYAFHSFITGNLAELASLVSVEHRDSQPESFLSSLLSAMRDKNECNLHVLLKRTVDASLKSHHGYLDLFLRFLCGISLERNQAFLKGLLTQTRSSSRSITKTCQYIKTLNTEGLSPDRCINLVHCMFEMNDQSMQEEIQKFMLSSKKSKQQLSPVHCSGLAYMLLMSEEVLKDFDMKQYNISAEGRRRLLPAFRCFREARLGNYEFAATLLQLPNSLITLDMSRNDVGDSGLELFCKGLYSPHCRLQILRLGGCKLTDASCEILALVLQSANTLIEMDLSDNNLGDSGALYLAEGLSSPHCRLQTLRLSGCLILEKGFTCLTAAWNSNPSLKELKLEV
ncbi:NACHT, LRR and PYD domains-containing protein 3-like [Engraulis encrasicolus]|uniref:NACHT, LRR and PYD domains-containing protein 3-like n=1 Tax=Engraulis encrasicolus TaxID=184585 RepID=UPI002FD61537